MLWHAKDVSGSASRVVYRFGAFELDAAAYELRREGERVRLARQPMELLLLLAERAGELVSREEIARQLWQDDVFVEVDAGIQTAVLKIRQALGDTARRSVETVPGKGYRLIAPVDVLQRDGHRPLSTSTHDDRPAPQRHNLPGERTPFVGRRKELEEIPQLLATSPLLTLTGSGGVGKTRLALRVALAVIEDFTHGVWMVDLGSLSGPELIPETIAAAIGLREHANRSALDTLRDHLRDRQILLILDTCEHVVAACAELVDALLHEAPALRVMTTTREPLSISGEVVYRVPPLSLPDESADPRVAVLSDAVQLFLARARAVDATIESAQLPLDSIVRICRRLDGVPLAIELAAARLAVLTPEQIEAKLQDRFGLLTEGSRTTAARQRTLKATLDWSYQLLCDPERALLDRLSVFPASWTIEAAERVCGGGGVDSTEVLNLLSRLVTKSLVTVDRECDAAAERRYRLLDTVREYAAAQLLRADAADDMRDRHFEFYYQLVCGLRQTLLHGEQVACLRRLWVERESLRAALAWGLSSSHHGQKGVELAGGLFWFWTKRALFAEGRLWLERAVAVRSSGSVRGWALIGLSHMDYFQGRLAAAEARSNEALSCVMEEPIEGDAAWIVGFARMMQGFIRFHAGDHDRCVELAHQAFDAVNLRFAAPLMLLGNVARLRGNDDDARKLYDEAIAICRSGEDAWALGIVLPVGAGLRITHGEFDDAQAMIAEAIRHCGALEDGRGTAWCVDVFAALLAARGDTDGAARFWGAADRLLESVGGSLNPEVKWIREHYLERTRIATGESRFAVIYADGRRLTVESAVASAKASIDSA